MAFRDTFRDLLIPDEEQRTMRSGSARGGGAGGAPMPQMPDFGQAAQNAVQMSPANLMANYGPPVAELGGMVGTGLVDMAGKGLGALAGMGQDLVQGRRPDAAAAAEAIEGTVGEHTYMPRGETAQGWLQSAAPHLERFDQWMRDTAEVEGQPGLSTALYTGMNFLDPTIFAPIPGAAVGGKALGNVARQADMQPGGLLGPDRPSRQIGAVGDDVNQPPRGLVDDGNPPPPDAAAIAPALQDMAPTSTVRLRSDPELNTQARAQIREIADRAGHKRVKTEDLLTYFEQQHQATHGRRFNQFDDADFNYVVGQVADEVRYQLRQPESGAGWYDNDILTTFQTLSDTFTELAPLRNNESWRVLWSALAGPSSNGNYVPQNARIATALMLEWARTGQVPTTPPPAGGSMAGIPGTGWGRKGPSVAAGNKIINHLLHDLAAKNPGADPVDLFADWWLSPHTVRELNEVRKAAGLKGGVTGVGGLDDVALGSMVIGDKTGRFSLNINGYEGTTKDRWFVRSYHRHFGDMRASDGAFAEAPRGVPERRRMEEFTRGIRENLARDGVNMDERDIQAVLWFYEQNLYSDLGVPTRPGAFSEGVGGLSEQVRSGVLGGNAPQIAAQPGGAVEGFRGVSPAQRTVRGERLRHELGEQFPGRGHRLDPGGPSQAYTREVRAADGGVGLLELVPNPETQARYQSAGLTAPAIRQLAPENAAQYHADLLAAMRDHPAGAQVTIKTPEQLVGTQMFRTEGGGGFAIAPDGDVVAVFQGPGEKRAGYAMLQAAVEAGGRKLDAFDTFLPRIYETVGFRPVARVRWNDEFAPRSVDRGGDAARDWNYADFAEFNDGRPDVLLFVYDPSYRGGLDHSTLPAFDDWGAAAAIQDQVLQQLHGAAGAAQGAAAPPGGLLDAGQPPGAAGGLLEAGAPPQGGGPVGGLLD